MKIIKCTNCKKSYAYELTGMVNPGAKERENAECPYCGEIGYSEMTSQSIYTYKLDENDEVIRN